MLKWKDDRGEFLVTILARRCWLEDEGGIPGWQTVPRFPKPFATANTCATKATRIACSLSRALGRRRAVPTATLHAVHASATANRAQHREERGGYEAAVARRLGDFQRDPRILDPRGNAEQVVDAQSGRVRIVLTVGACQLAKLLELPDRQVALEAIADADGLALIDAVADQRIADPFGRSGAGGETGEGGQRKNQAHQD